MKTYLSMGFGINSVALYLYLTAQGKEFEAVFVDHGADWPETYEYAEMFTRKYPVTIIKPKLGNLYDYCWKYRIVPNQMRRWCTVDFKIKPIHSYYQRPAWNFVGIDAGEPKRARLSGEVGIENEYPLIDDGIDRKGCEKIIKEHGLPLPRKSGCYICPFQRISQWKELRRLHPDLFCKAEQLEKRNIGRRISKGKKPLYLYGKNYPLTLVVQENQKHLFKEDEYPPCHCEI